MRYLLALFFVTGCASSAPLYAPQSVEVPVAISCVADKPISPPDDMWRGIGENDNLAVKTRALIAGFEERLAYEKKLEALIAACR